MSAPPPDNDAIIRLVGLHKAFGDLVVLDDVSLDIPRGKTTAIIGPSGTGKSVLIKHIVGLLEPRSAPGVFGFLLIPDISIGHVGPAARRFRRRQMAGRFYELAKLSHGDFVPAHVERPRDTYAVLGLLMGVDRLAEHLEISARECNRRGLVLGSGRSGERVP